MRSPSIQLKLFSDNDGLHESTGSVESLEGQLIEGAQEQEGQVPLSGEGEVWQDPEGRAEQEQDETELSLDGLDEKRLRSHVCGWLEPLYLRSLSERVQVKWNSRLQTTAGRAHYNESRIELNPRLIAVADLAEIERTLKHELAHLVAYERCAKVQRRRLQPHGREWREACEELGISGEARCHELALPGRRMQRKFSYACPACGEKIERVKRFRGYVACHACCRTHSGGRYDQRFQLVERRL